MALMGITVGNFACESISEAYFYGTPITEDQRLQVARQLTTPHNYSWLNNGFINHPGPKNRAQTRLFSGELIRTNFAQRHLQLIETTRLFILLDVSTTSVEQFILRAKKLMRSACYAGFCTKGECKALSIAYMRYLAVKATADAGERIRARLNQLSAHRDGNGKWDGFPYYYTLLMLSETVDALSRAELSYAAPRVEKLLARGKSSGPFAERRQTILVHALARS
jgi:hypothetical protein